MKTIVMCAGLAMCSAAFAQDPVAEFVPADQVHQVPQECFTGAIRPRLTPAVHQTVVYNNQSLATGFWTTTAATNIGLDDIALAPGPGLTATYPLLITAMDFGFQVKTLAGGTFDMEVTFYDTVSVAAAAGTSVIATSPIIGGPFIIPFAAIPATGVYTTGSVDLTGLPGGGITLPDGGCFVRVRYLQHGTQNLMATTDIGCAFQSGIKNAGTDWACTKPVGSSHNGMWVNNDGDGTPLEVADRVGFAYPAALDWAIKMEITEQDAPPACIADFNGDTVVDFFDYLDFVDAFSAGCP